MDELPNTHYIPSFFEVTPSGRQLIISQFHDQYPDIFVGYENNINAFFINTNDDDAITTLIKIFAAQINLFQSGRYGDAPESPKMLPLKFTTVGNSYDTIASTAQITKLDLNPLIDLDEDSEESSDNTSLSGDSSTYWAPKSGNLSILQRDLVNGIANLTGCIFCPEPEHRRMRLVSGNTQAALAKLRRLEPLLEQLARNGSAPIPRVDHNILSLSCQIKGTGVCYVPTIRRPHAERIMVGPMLEDRVESMFVGEEQIYNESTGKYTRAEYLNVVYAKEDPAETSNIWANYRFQSFGDPENAIPNVPSAGTSVVSSINTIRPNEHMDRTEQARVRDWSKNVDSDADPTQVVSIPALSEPGVEESASKRVVARSDSDDEEVVTEEVKYKVIAEDSDDEVPSSITKVQNSTLRNQRDLRSQRSPDPDNTTPGTRAGRANRRREDNVPVSFVSQGTRSTTNFVAADSFFAGVPRDEEAPGEARFRTIATSSQPPMSIDTEPKKLETQRTRPDRGFGYDGAADDPDEYQPMQHSNYPPDPRNISSVLTTAIPQQSEQTNTYRPGPGFDPSQYGASRRGRNRNFGRTYPTQQNVYPSPQSQQPPVPIWPQPPIHAGINAGTQRRVGPPAQSRRTQDQLIDCSEDVRQQPTSVMPPPGLSPRKRLNEADAVRSSHILDSPLDEIQRPSIQPSWDDNIVPQNGEPSISTSSSSGPRHLHLDYNVQTKINKPDVGYMRNSMVSQLLAIQQKRKSRKEPTAVTEHASERIDPEDETTTRKFYNTMNLKAPNQGKGKKGKGGGPNFSNGETRAQAAERIAKAKAELGLIPPPARKPLPPTQEPEKEKLSKRAQQAAKSNPEMAKLHAGSLKEASRKRITQELVEYMKDTYEVARLFPGYVTLEFQIGQMLVMPSSRLKPSTVYETEKWKSLFNSGVNSAEVFFTNLLTTNGSDVDGILEYKTDKMRTWSKEAPGPCSVVLEFECLDSSGSEFKLHLNTDGTYSLSKHVFVIQQIGLHCPGRTWDTCVMLKGVPAWHDIPETLQSSVADLIASVYMSPGQQVDVLFRTPSDNSITVREVTVKRTSRHDSQLAGEKDVQLKIVEIKTLYMTNHKKDKRLTRCSEREYDEMAQNDRVHFEVSVVDAAINASLEKNETLEVGEVASFEESESSPINSRRILCVLDSALRLVDKIDWVGACNVGTIVQRQFLRVRKEEEAARSMPPTMLDHSFLRPVHLSAGLSVAGPRSVAGARTVISSANGGNTLMSVHGIRSGTRAQTVTDGQGNYFRIGLGGARIPIDRHDDASTAHDAVAPDDSASQIGRSSRTARSNDVRPDSFW